MANSNFKINGTDVQDLLPKFPESDNENYWTYLDGYDTIHIIPRNSTTTDNTHEPWTKGISLRHYLPRSYYPGTEIDNIEIFNPAYKPSFKKEIYSQSGAAGSWGRCRIEGEGDNEKLVFINEATHERTERAKSYFPNNVIPKRIIVVLQASGGQGCGADEDRICGAGGAGGGCWIGVVDLEGGQLQWGCAGRLDYNKVNGSGRGEGTANGANGGDSYIEYYRKGTVSGYENIAYWKVQAYGGRGATWWDSNSKFARGGGNYGDFGNVNVPICAPGTTVPGNGYEYTYTDGATVWGVAKARGGDGGSGTRPGTKKNPAKNESTHAMQEKSLIGEERGDGRPASKTKIYLPTVFSSCPEYSLSGVAWQYRKGFPTWAAGGGSGFLGLGGEGAARDETGYRHGRMGGYGGGGGGGVYGNWGGGSDGGIIKFYF